MGIVEFLTGLQKVTLLLPAHKVSFRFTISTNTLDSHGDVHAPRCFDSSIKDSEDQILKTFGVSNEKVYGWTIRGVDWGRMHSSEKNARVERNAQDLYEQLQKDKEEMFRQMGVPKEAVSEDQPRQYFGMDFGFGESPINNTRNIHERLRKASEIKNSPKNMGTDAFFSTDPYRKRRVFNSAQQQKTNELVFDHAHWYTLQDVKASEKQAKVTRRIEALHKAEKLAQQIFDASNGIDIYKK